ncbi:hypothetical protein FKM82_027759 [Ascaphus truei]
MSSRQAAEVVCASPTYIMCSASTSSGSMLPQGDGPGEELLLSGDCHCCVISHSHSGVFINKVIFIVDWDVADCPMQLPALAAHLFVLSLCQVRPPVLKWDSLFSLRDHPCARSLDTEWLMTDLIGQPGPLVTALGSQKCSYNPLCRSIHSANYFYQQH